MDIGLIMKLFHVLAAFWFIAGVIGRDYTFWRAAKVNTVLEVQGLLHASDFFERLGVILGGFIVLVFGLLVSLTRGWPLLGFLQGSDSNWLLVSLILYLSSTLIVPLLGLIKRRDQRTKALERALGQNQITPELTNTLHDKVIRGYRISELFVLVIIIILMVTKPF